MVVNWHCMITARGRLVRWGDPLTFAGLAATKDRLSQNRPNSIEINEGNLGNVPRAAQRMSRKPVLDALTVNFDDKINFGTVRHSSTVRFGPESTVELCISAWKRKLGAASRPPTLVFRPKRTVQLLISPRNEQLWGGRTVTKLILSSKSTVNGLLDPF